MEINLIIAKNLKRLRTERNLSLGQLAQMCGVSKMMLSQIERGETNPTVNTVWKIASGLNIPYPVLFEQKENDTNIIKSHNIIPQQSEDEHYKIFWYFLRSDSRNIDMLMIEIDADHEFVSLGQTDKSFEYLIVLEGELLLTIDDKQYHLTANDAASFKASLKHTYHNCGKSVLRILSIDYYLI
jgi:transcriptional regulator with XRE-family HTH domain